MKINKDNRGSLGVIEFKELPFIAERCFWIYDVPIYSVRGCHAHKQTKQYCIVTQGVVRFKLDDGFAITTQMVSEGKSIFIDKMIFASQKYLTENAKMIVFTDTEYDKSDYITDYEEFKQCIAQRNYTEE